MSARGEFRIGTSGWAYNHWRGRFYPRDLPARKWLSHYAGAFNTVEINNTFYRLPPASRFDAWKEQAPPGFLYAVKASRYLTHVKRLKNPRQPLGRLLRRARRLKGHLGPILYQLPPNWKPDLDRLRKFCAKLPADLTHVIEFRDREWLNEDTFKVLEEHGVCLCLHDMFKRHSRRITGKAIYIRFHGAGAKYGGSYSPRKLRAWAECMRKAANNGLDVYAYFNNDRNGYAVRNARTLRRILGVE